MNNAEFLNDEHRIWFALLSLLTSGVFFGIGFIFLKFGLSTGNDVAKVVAYIATAYIDLNGLAFFANGVYNLAVAVKP